MRCLAALILLLVVAACATPAPNPSPSQPSSPTASPAATPPPTLPSIPAPSPSPSPARTASPAPSASITCITEPIAATSGAGGDPCPTAIDAVRAVVAPLGLPIAQIYIEPGPFQCGGVWPGFQSMPLCAGVPVVRGAQMHGWVAFTGSAKVAAVQLTRTPPHGATPGGPWKATIVAFEVPPTGWTMP